MVPNCGRWSLLSWPLRKVFFPMEKTDSSLNKVYWALTGSYIPRHGAEGCKEKCNSVSAPRELTIEFSGWSPDQQNQRDHHARNINTQAPFQTNWVQNSGGNPQPSVFEKTCFKQRSSSSKVKTTSMWLTYWAKSKSVICPLRKQARSPKATWGVGGETETRTQVSHHHPQPCMAKVLSVSFLVL